ncbi:hypothetical protein CAP51_13145 [Acinetobacter populi]|uniref:Cytochrome ubiquinol oxidase subunit I n=1 Tax=Acinetobacter populi TaxID=1582270 RepID=A0A1Z9YVG9_9GAMM|nr:hypothetical protein CAP51_13145 [Acinetobacter populi]
MNLGLTALELARIQFTFTVSFHIIFPAISIGLASFLAVLEWKWLHILPCPIGYFGINLEQVMVITKRI